MVAAADTAGVTFLLNFVPKGSKDFTQDLIVYALSVETVLFHSTQLK